MHQAVAAAGLRFIDCPATGGRPDAETGTLPLLVGADEATLAAARPVLEVYSKEIIHFGPAGAGTAYKMVVNLMAAVQATALVEGLLLAEKAGLDPAAGRTKHERRHRRAALTCLYSYPNFLAGVFYYPEA